MTENDLINVIVDELRTMASDGENTSSLLRRVQHLFGRKDCKIVTVQCFHKAFGAGVAAVSPVAGWHGFGGELTDPEVDSYCARFWRNIEGASYEIGFRLACVPLRPIAAYERGMGEGNRLLLKERIWWATATRIEFSERFLQLDLPKTNHLSPTPYKPGPRHP